MTKKTTFQVALEDLEYKTFSYSGRRMNGKQCLAVSLDGDVKFLCADLLDYVIDNPDLFDFVEFSDAIRSMETDSLGKGLVAYFPAFEYGDEEEEEEEEEYEMEGNLLRP